MNNNFEESRKSKKHIFLVLAISLVLIILISAIKLGIFIYNWQTISKDMILNSPSQVLDNNGKVIAKIGNNRNTKNVSIKDVPDNLKNAYIAIEDQRFYNHSGVDIHKKSRFFFFWWK